MRKISLWLVGSSWLLAGAANFVRAGELAGTPRELRTSRSATMDLEQGFARPPNEAKPRVYWWWLNSQVTREAITRDLEEMRRQGIGGALIFDAGAPAGPTPLGPQFLSDAWRELFRHAVREADRLGLELSVNLCSGWDAGGPWIKPEHACRRVAFSVKYVTGPAEFNEKLPLPEEARERDFRDAVVLAVPVSKKKARVVLPKPKVTASSQQERYPVSNVADGNRSTFWVSDGWKAGDGPSPEKPEWVRFDFPEAVEVSLVAILPRRDYGPHRTEVQIAKDGKTFATVAEHVGSNTGDFQLVRFSKVTTRCVRLMITSAFSFGSTKTPWNVQVQEIAFQEPEAAIPEWSVKAAQTGAGYAPAGSSFVSRMESAEYDESERYDVIAPDSVIDLTEKLDSAGRFRWKVPAGEWNVLRFGHVLAGYRTHAASGEKARGLEVDWLSAPAMDFHFAATAEKLLEDAGPLAGKTLRYFHDDSWEVGVPNWTDGILETFRRTRGYDPTPYLLVLAGRVVGDREVSERFLYDYRKTIGTPLRQGARHLGPRVARRAPGRRRRSRFRLHGIGR